MEDLTNIICTQVTNHLDWQFQRRRFLFFSQSETRLAHSGQLRRLKCENLSHNRRAWYTIWRWNFLSIHFISFSLTTSITILLLKKKKQYYQIFAFFLWSFNFDIFPIIIAFVWFFIISTSFPHHNRKVIQCLVSSENI